jgi:hypothetical protein
MSLGAYCRTRAISNPEPTDPRGAPERRHAFSLERVMGIEPTPSAWKAEVLPLNYTREGPKPRIAEQADKRCRRVITIGAAALVRCLMVEGGGFEPPKAEPSDLQSDPFDRSGTPPNRAAQYTWRCLHESTAPAPRDASPASHGDSGIRPAIFPGHSRLRADGLPSVAGLKGPEPLFKH